MRLSFSLSIALSFTSTLLYIYLRDNMYTPSLALAIYLLRLLRVGERREAEAFAPPSAFDLPQRLMHARQAHQGSF